jgi:ubiquinone/menaquinone biosynthesis C-methylase UbiE
MDGGIMGFSWGAGFSRYLDEPWSKSALESLALKYDTVEHHGWYDNLDFTVEQMLQDAMAGEVIIDYSGGTGILTQRLLNRAPNLDCGVLIADSSPKFLRLALAKFQEEERVAFRLIHYLKGERRLQELDEVIGLEELDRPVDAITSTNAIHLYYALVPTLASWHRVLRPGGRVYVQSGNIRDPDAEPDAWIIDETVEHIHRAAVKIVEADSSYADLRPLLADQEYMGKHDTLRQKYFLPVRSLDTYTDAMETAGFHLVDVQRRSIAARVDEWHSFLAVYHEGVLGWLGGAEKITGEKVSDETVTRRQQLMRRAMDVIFNGQETFAANWTYIRCKK